MNKKITIYIIPILIAIFNVLIILFPSEIILSSKNGLLLWFNNVIPSLLPFMIGANILVQTGFTAFFGTLLEPVMQRLFKISGCGAFSLTMGLISGYPMGAKITASLYETKQINEIEAQKLIMFTNNSGPLFILGTVAVSMLKIPESGTLIILSHYLSAIITGIVLRNYKKSSSKTKRELFSIKTALKKIELERKKNNMPFGSILSKSIIDSVNSITAIGGFIILFSVISKITELTNISLFSKKIFSPIFNILNINTDLISPLTSGILEITNGCKALSEFPPTITTIALCAGLISWGGFSIHAQAISFLTKTKIKIMPYILSKACQGILSIIIVYILSPFFKINFQKTAETFAQNSSQTQISTMPTLTFLILLILVAIFSIMHVILQNAKQNRKFFSNEKKRL